MKIEYTLYTNTQGYLTKEYTIQEGKLCSNSTSSMFKGTAQHIQSTFEEFCKKLKNLPSNQSFGYGLYSDKYGDCIDIVIKGKENSRNNIISRTQEYFKFYDKPGILMLDHDTSDHGITVTPQELLTILSKIDPQIAKATYIIRPSVSAGVSLKGQMPKSNTGFHIYFVVKKASDIPRYGKLLYDHLWLNGYGYIKLSKICGTLPRTLIDETVFKAHGLDYVGQPVIEDKGIVYNPPKIEFFEGHILDTTELKNLTKDQEDKVKELIKEKKNNLSPKLLELKKQCKKSFIGKERKNGLSKEKAEKYYDSLSKSKRIYLHPDSKLIFSDGEKVSVKDVLANPKKYDKTTLYDPFDDEIKNVRAIFYWNNGIPIIHSFAHGEQNYYLKRNTKLIKNVPPYYPQKDVYDVEEAREKLNKYISKWIDNPSSNMSMAAPAGIGKTRAIITKILNSLKKNKHILDKKEYFEIYVPNHTLANQIKNEFLHYAKQNNTNVRVQVIRGRTHSDKDNQPLCHKHDVVSKLAGSDISIYTNICETCDFCKKTEQHDRCSYLEQFKDDTQVRIFTHAYLPLKRGYLDSKFPDLAIIDESFYIKNMLNDKRILFSELKELLKKCLGGGGKVDKNNARLINIIFNSLNDGKPLLKELRDTFGDNVLLFFENVIFITITTPPAINEYNIDENAIKEYKTEKALFLMMSNLNEELKNFPNRKHSISVRLVTEVNESNKKIDYVEIANRHTITRFTKKIDDDNTIKAPVLLIDADYSPKLGKLFFSDIKQKRLRVKRNCHVTQIYSTTNAKTRLYARIKAKEHEQKAIKNHINNLQAAIDKIEKLHKKVLLVTYKDVIENNLFTIGELSSSKHFGALRGLNDYEKYPAVIIIGRLQLPIQALESQAASLWWDDSDDLILTGEPCYKDRGFRFTSLRHKALGVNVMVCADERTNLLQSLQRECETLQALDRLRLINEDETKHVYILSNVPLDIDVDRLCSLKKLITGPNIIQKALMESECDILPIAPKHLIENYPEIFTDDTAKKAHEKLSFWDKKDEYLEKGKLVKMKSINYNLSKVKVSGRSGQPFYVLSGLHITRDNLCTFLRSSLDKDKKYDEVQILKTTIRDDAKINDEIDMMEEFYSSGYFDPEVGSWCVKTLD